MELKEMTIEALEERKSAIVAELDTEGADLDTLEEEMRSIVAEMEARKQAEAQKNEIRTKVAEGEGTVVKQFKEEKRNMKDIKEYRNSQEYMDAYAEYIKTGDDSEVRSLLTTNVGTGTIAVPTVVESGILTAWNDSKVLERVTRINVKGNYKVGFEISGSDAVVHTEGSGKVTEEELTIGTVEIKPESIKKWISVSDEALDMRGEEFLQYITDEISYKIVAKAEELLIGKIAALPGTATSSQVSAATVKEAPGVGTIISAYSNLSSRAHRGAIIVMNPLTYAAFKAVQNGANYNVDIFEGLEVAFSDALPAYATASEDDVYAIVGDFGYGARAVVPDGDDVQIKIDDKTLMEEDLVRILGRKYIGVAPVACKAFALISKPATV